MSTVIEVITKIVYILLPVLLGYLVWLLKEERTERKDIKTEQSAVSYTHLTLPTILRV